MQAIIMAAGLGTRLRPLTETTPKPMLPVAGRPLLERLIESLPRQVDEVILVVGYLKEKISAHFEDSWDDRHIVYREQSELKGTGHAVAACRDLIDGHFLVLNGDCLYDTASLEKLASRDLAILAARTSEPGKYSVLGTGGTKRLQKISEPMLVEAGAMISAGAYALDERFFDEPLVPIKDGEEFGLPQTLAAMAQYYPVAIIEADEWFHIGTPEDLQEATKIISANESSPNA
jgi:UDP-N-acetylglucosamine diphosphorylase / glucose-1-phosphate thymidylyltransferase / UDP-N-acetylgalactosamine diphosphorylase / glucosamine-1-phosphate N-acetyltransferase / galactosamine-1-phosphate N-acetyltransferase